MNLPTAHAKQATTQKFTDIIDIIGSVVIMTGGSACMVIEVVAANFALLSPEEQQSKLYAYAGLLNSLTYPIQILIRNKRVDVSSYVTELAQAEHATTNPLLAKHISMYKQFVMNLVRVNVVLNKTFYIIIPFSSLEAGFGGAKHMVQTTPQDIENIADTANKILRTKAESLRGQINKFALSSKVLGKEELTNLFYDIYNDHTIDMTEALGDINQAMIKQKGVT